MSLAEVTRKGLPPDNSPALRDVKDRASTSPYVVGLIFFLATLLCFLFLGRKSFDLDEVSSVTMARLDGAPFWRLLQSSEANMMFYYILLRLWLAFGLNEATVRILSVLPALATVPLFYALGKRLLGTQIALIGSLLLVVNSFYISYAQWARSYSLLLFLITLSSLFYVRAIERPSPKNWMGYVISSTLAVYTHLFGGLVLAAHWIFPFAFMRRRNFPWKTMAAMAFAIGLLTLPIGILALRGDIGQISYIPRLSLFSAYPLLSLTGALAGAGIDRIGTKFLELVYLLLATIGVAAMKGTRLSVRAPHSWQYGFVLTWLMLPVLIAVGVSVAIQPIMQDRYFIIILPPLVLLASIGISQIRPKSASLGALCLVLLLSMRSLYFYYYEFQRDDWRATIQFISSHARSQDALILYAPYTRTQYEYYADRLKATVRPIVVYPRNSYSSERGPEVAPNFAARTLDGYARVWLILSHNTLGHYTSGGIIIASLKPQFRLTESQTFSGIHVLLYSRKMWLR